MKKELSDFILSCVSDALSKHGIDLHAKTATAFNADLLAALNQPIAYDQVGVASPLTRNFIHGKFTEFENLNLFCFITQRATHKVHGDCDFGMMLPNIHGLIKLILNGNEKPGINEKVFCAVQGYLMWERYSVYSELSYDPINNYWEFAGSGDRNESLADILNLVLSEVQ